jgi:hypothetical protein
MVELAKYPYSAEVSIDEGKSLLRIADARSREQQVDNGWARVSSLALVIGPRPDHAIPVGGLRKSYKREVD